MANKKKRITKAFKIEPSTIKAIEKEAKKKDLTFSSMVREIILRYLWDKKIR